MTKTDLKAELLAGAEYCAANPGARWTSPHATPSEAACQHVMTLTDNEELEPNTPEFSLYLLLLAREVV